MTRQRKWGLKSALVLAGALAFAAAAGAEAAPLLMVNGQALPVHVVKKTIHIPGGIMQIESVSYGNAGPGSAPATVQEQQLSPQQARMLIAQMMAPLQQMQAMQVAMAQQMAAFQHEMAVSFGAPMVAPLGNALPMRIWMRLPVQTPPFQAAPSAPMRPVPSTSLPGHGTYAVSLPHPVPTNPKIPL